MPKFRAQEWDFAFVEPTGLGHVTKSCDQLALKPYEWEEESLVTICHHWSALVRLT